MAFANFSMGLVRVDAMFTVNDNSPSDGVEGDAIHTPSAAAETAPSGVT